MKKLAVLLHILALVVLANAAFAQVDTVWTRTYSNNSNSDEHAGGCALDNNGNIYIVGSLSLDGTAYSYDFFVIKYNTVTGDTVWSRSYNGSYNQDDYGRACAIDDSGYVYVTGNSYSNTITTWDYMTIKINPANGDPIWTRRYNSPFGLSDEAKKCVTNGGFLYVAGYSSSTTGADFLIIKYDAITGDTIWTKRYDNNGKEDILGDCVRDNNGRLYVTGASNSRVWTLVLDTNGDTLRSMTDSTHSQEGHADIFNNVLYILSWTPTPGGADVTGYDTLGQIVSNTHYPQFDIPQDFAIDKTGNRYLTCSKAFIVSNNDIYTLKTNQNGDTIWSTVYNGPANYNDGASGCVVDSLRNVYICGSTCIDGVYNYDLLLIKYQQAVRTPVLVSPLDSYLTNNTTVNFCWNKVDSAGVYRFERSKYPGFDSLVLRINTADTTIVLSTIPEGTHYWRVKAYKTGNADSSAWSAVRRFVVDTAPPPAPTLRAPADNAWIVANPPTVRWAPQAGIWRYHVQVSSDTAFGSFIDTITTVDSFRTVAASVADGKYFWRVSAQDSAGNWSPFSGIRRIRVDATPPKITWTNPADGAPVFLFDDTIKIAFSEPIIPGSFSYNLSPTVPLVNGGESAGHDTMKLWSSMFSLATAYTLTVTAATDSAGNALVAGAVPNPWTFTTTSDTGGPVITHTPVSTPVNAGYDVVIDAGISDGSGIGITRVYYRKGGEHTYTQMGMSPTGPGTYRTTIPAVNVGKRGLSYYITAQDGYGNQTLSPAGAPNERYQRTVTVDTAAPPQPQPAGVYQMISVPFMSSGTPWRPYEFVDDLGQYDDTQWRLFRWQAVAYAEFNAVQDIIPGRAYWLITKNSNKVDVLAANTVPDSAQYIPLAQGWNMVGAPFAYDVNLADVQVFDGSGNNAGFLDTANTLTEHRLVGYDGSGYSNQTQLNPWAGYWVRALVPNVTMLVQAAAAVKKAAAAEEPAGGWSLALAAQSGPYHDRDNRIGVTPRGPRDNVSEPPVMGPHLSLAVASGGRQLAEDYRSAIGSGQDWRFTVSTGQPGPVELSWREGGSNSGWQYALYDVTAGQVLPQSGSYRYQAGQNGGTREFAVLAGGADYIQREAGRAGLVPSISLLEQNCPNPAPGWTIISYQLATAGKAEVSVYNIAGQRVRTLVNAVQPAGRYRVTWTGGDNQGRQLGNGVYFYKLEVHGYSGVKKMIVIR